MLRIIVTHCPAYGVTPGAGADYVWVKGLLSATPNDPANWNYDITVRAGVLWPYCGNSVSVWHCPADASYGIDNTGKRVPRVRSVSMSNWVGGNGDAAASGYRGNFGLSGRWVVYRKTTQMSNPGPASTY